MTVRLGRQGELFWRNRCVCDRGLSLKSVARIQTISNFCATGHNDKPLSLRQIFSREFSKLHWENYRCDKAGRNFPVIGSLMRFGLKFSLISRKYFTQGKLSEVRGICAKWVPLVVFSGKEIPLNCILNLLALAIGLTPR